MYVYTGSGSRSFDEIKEKPRNPMLMILTTVALAVTTRIGWEVTFSCRGGDIAELVLVSPHAGNVSYMPRGGNVCGMALFGMTLRAAALAVVCAVRARRR